MLHLGLPNSLDMSLLVRVDHAACLCIILDCDEVPIYTRMTLCEISVRHLDVQLQIRPEPGRDKFTGLQLQIQIFNGGTLFSKAISCNISPKL